MKSAIFQRFIPDFEKTYAFDAPASKSILNRALLLAAFSDGDVFLKCASFAEDTHAFLNCFTALGIRYENRPNGILIHGTGKKIPNQNATLNVMNAGTCARFLPAALSAIGGNYDFTAFAQMKNRPMDFLTELKKAGVEIDFSEKENAFPFRLRSEGFKRREFTVDTDTSTQFASALLLAGAVGNAALRVNLTGSRTEGSYVLMTLSLLSAFGAEWTRNQNTVTVFPAKHFPKEFEVETDVSAACYFYALALLFGITILVRGVKKNSLQGDIRFLELLERRVVRFTETETGLLADGSGISSFEGFQENFGDFSDQTLTAAALAPFASTPSRITGIGHIRRQECDRIEAIRKNLTALGVPCLCGENYIEISPAKPNGGTIETCHDHRVAMAFTLPALKTGTLVIDDPECCKKTFDGYLDEIKKLFS